jgi:hypothetical protein
VAWVALAAVTSAAAGCVAEPDVLVTVTRSTTVAVDLFVCDPASPTQCTSQKSVFYDSQPSSVERTIGLYLDEPIAALNLEFMQTNPPLCHALTVPVGDPPLELSLALPDTAEASIAAPTGCPDCAAIACMRTGP